METVIRLNNIQLFGYHGVYDNERTDGQKFEIDVQIKANVRKAIDKDEISETIDYSCVYNDIVKVFSSKKYQLIEKLANDISYLICKRYKINNCKVVIRKPNVLILGCLDNVEVEINSNG